MSNNTPIWQRLFKPPFKICNYNDPCLHDAEDTPALNVPELASLGLKMKAAEIRVLKQNFIEHAIACLNNAATIESYKEALRKEIERMQERCVDADAWHALEELKNKLDLLETTNP